MKLGNLDIKDIYVGSTPAAQVYFGDVKVWPEEQPAGDYWGLCFTAEDPEVSVSLHANSASAPQVNLLYSRDAVNWQTFTPDSTTVVLDNVGDKVWLKAGPGGNAGMGSSTSNSHSFRIENGRAAASGSIMSLLSGEAETYEIPAGQQGCFAQLFGSAVFPNTTCLLTRSPDLPATTLGRNCYRDMFQGCTSLTAAPALPATTLAEKCYYYMFQNCTSLSSAPALPATTLANECYNNMFQGCTSLTSISASFTEWTSNTTTNWVDGVAANGIFHCPVALSDVYDASHIPVGWGRGSLWNVNAVKFDNIGNTTGVVRLVRNESEALSDLADWEYSSDGSSWTAWDKTSKELSVDVGDSLYVRAGETGQSRLASNDSFNRANRILPMSSSFKVSGPLSSLLSKSGTIPAGPTQFQFASLFLQGTGLVDASELEIPSTVARQGFARTFGITGLSAAPVLPATTLNFGCYYFMFGQCTSLSTPPALPATTLSGSCCQSMFYDCTSLTAVPRLTMTNLNSNCYQYMFQGCTSLTSTGNLTANGLVQDCYSYMFADSGIVSAYFPGAWASDLSGDQYTVFGKNSQCGGLTMFNNIDPSQILVTYLGGTDLLSSFLPKAEEVEGVKFTNVDSYGNTATVQITDVGDASNNGGACDLIYTTDGENWEIYSLEDVIYLQSQNDYVIFKANGPSGSGIKSVSDNSYYKFVVSQNNVLVEGNLAYLYSDDPENNNMEGDYQFAHLFEYCDFVAYSDIASKFSSLKMPEEVKWMGVGYSNVFSYIFANTTLARITIPVDSSGWTNGWSAYGAYSNWVYGISDGGQSGLITLPSYFSIYYGYSYIPYNWSYEN